MDRESRRILQAEAYGPTGETPRDPANPFPDTRGLSDEEIVRVLTAARSPSLGAMARFKPYGRHPGPEKDLQWTIVVPDGALYRLEFVTHERWLVWATR